MSFEKLNTSLIINNTANATSHLTGSLQILGGAGIAKDLYIGGATDVFVSPAQSALSVMGSIKTSKTIYIGLSANITTAPIYIASDALDGGVLRSFADPNNVIGDGAWNRYLDIACFGSSNGTIGGGSIRFFTNPVNSTNVVERMRLKTDGTLGILATTDSTVLDTGAFQVAGGGSIAKNLNIGGSVFAGNVKTIEALSGSETPVMYPPNGTRILTGNSTNVTNQPYGNGSYYIASDSAAGGFPAWNAFGNKGEVWSSGNRYSTTTGAYTGGRTTTDSAGTVFAGDLIDLGLPSSKLITSFTIYPRAGALNNAPTTFAIFNSVNNVMYLIYHQSSPITWSDNSSKTFTLATPTLSSYIRLVFMTKSPSDVYVQLSFTFTASTPYVQISGTTDATGTNTGALQILGGASIAKTLHTGGLQVTNITNSATGPAAFGGIPFNGSLHVLSNAATAAESTMSFFAKNSRTMAAAGDMYTLGISGQSGTVTAGNFGISGWNGTAAQNYLQITPAGVVSITSSLDASSLSAAAFLVVGGASVTKNVLVGGNVNLTINPLSSRIQLGNTVTNYIIIGAPLGDASGDFHIYDATGTGGRIFGYYRSPETIYLGKASGTTNVVLAGTTDSTSTTTGALQVVGGAGIAKNVTVGGEVISYISTGFGQFRAVNGNFGVMFRNDGTIFYLLSTASGAPLGVWNANRPFQYTMATNGISSDSPWSLTNTTDSTSATTGALQVTGGAGITKSLHVGTAITVGAANTGAAQNALNVTGNGTNYVQFNLQNTSSGGGGLSIAANGSATSDTVGGNGGIYMWNARLNNFCLHMKATGEIILPVTLDATSTTTGALQVRGGLAVTKSIFSAGLNSSITHAAATNVNQLVTRFDANWGIRLNQNYVGSGDIFYQWYNTYNNFERLWLTVRNDTTTLSHPSVVISSTIDSTSGITGALQVAGGIGIAKSLTVGENIMTGTINGASYNKVFQQATNVATFYKIATLPVSTISTFDHIHIIATLNYNYNATANSEIDAMFANRNGFAYYYEARGYLPISTNATVVVYNNAGQADIYIRLTTGFLTASCTVVEAQNCTVYSTVAGATTVPTGTIIFDASNPTVYAPNRQTDASGNTATTTLALHDTFSGSEVAMLYPPTGNQILTGVNTTLTNLPYGNGLYYIAASSTFDGNFQPWFAFQDKSVSNPWSSHSRYNATGAYTGAVTTQDVVAGVSYAGEVIEVTLPATKYVTSITIYPRIANPLNAPATFVIMGSSTINAAYKVIYNQSTATTWTESTGKTFTLTTPGIYNWIRIVVQTIGANAPGGTFAQFTFSLRASNPYIYITNTAEATSTTSGALQVGGGAGITKNLHVGGTLNVPGTMTTVTDLRFPPAAMTATTTTLTNQSYGNGTYVVTSSSQNPYASVHTVFDYTGMADAGWHSDGAADLYNGDTGVFAGTTSTTIGGTAVAGAWLQLQVPVSFTLKEFTMVPRSGNLHSRAPRSWILAGSNNGTTWTAIDTRTGEQSWTAAPKSFVVTNTTAYLYFRLVVREVGNLTSGAGTLQNVVNLSEVAFYAAEHQLRFASTIDSISATTGAMQIAGGLGVAKTLNVGGVTTINQTTGDLVILKSATTTGKNDILFHNTTTGRLGYVGLDGIGLLNSNMDAMTIFSPATKPIQLYSDTSVNIIGGAGINVGTAPTTVTSKLAVNGTNVSMSGPHIAYYTSVDTQPLFHQLNWTHDNINLGFDTYYDGVWRSSTAASASAKIAKVSGALVFQYAPAAAVGTAVSHVNAMVVECATGAVTSHQTRILSDARSIFGSGLFTGNNGNAANVGDGRINIQDLSGICASFYVHNTKAGSITASGTTVAYNTTSDYRLKTNIEPVNDAKQKLQLIKPKRFNWIDGNVGEKSYGFIAHEIAEVLPEAVTGEKDAVDAEGKPVHQMLDSTKLIPLLTAALQETMKELALLKAEIVELKNRDV